MIPDRPTYAIRIIGKPRASGDDPAAQANQSVMDK